MESLRILLVHNYYRIRGGEDSVFENEKRLLEAAGHTVIPYTRHNDDAGAGFFGKLRLPFTALYSRKTYREIKRIIKRERIDIVHVHNTQMLISPTVFRAAKRMGVPAVQTVHNFRMVCPAATLYRDGAICEECIAHGFSPSVRHRCYRGSRFQSLLLASVLRLHRFLGTFRHVHFICLTEFNREMLLRANRKRTVVDPERIYIKPNFASATAAPPIPFAERERAVLFAGRLDPLKGVDVLLDAAQKLSDGRILIAGTGPEQARMCERIAAEGLSERVVMLGQKTPREVRELMGRVRATVLPTLWYEGFPMTIAESLSVGTPVIVSDLGNAGAIVREGETGLHFPAGDGDALAACIRSLPDLVDSSRAYYEEHLAPEANLRLLTEIYRDILKEL